MYPVKKIKFDPNIPKNQANIDKVVARVAKHHLENHHSIMTEEEKKICQECIDKCKH